MYLFECYAWRAPHSPPSLQDPPDPTLPTSFLPVQELHFYVDLNRSSQPELPQVPAVLRNLRSTITESSPICFVPERGLM
mmetsp:Transcript_107098/g.313203  ORF Transcript_107098/g.313203 Transcript_107098/m.313203 type:complete len:80 (+) Transcript_107098:2238-2477(+)